MTPVLAKGTLLSLALFLGLIGMQLTWDTDRTWQGVIVLVLAVACAFAREIIKPIVNK